MWGKLAEQPVKAMSEEVRTWTTCNVCSFMLSCKARTRQCQYLGNINSLEPVAWVADVPPRHPPHPTPPLCLVAARTSLLVVCEKAVALVMVTARVLALAQVMALCRARESLVLAINYVHLKYKFLVDVYITQWLISSNTVLITEISTGNNKLQH